jgi:hypothetical protein
MNELKTNEVDISNFDLDELCTATKIDKMFSIDMKSVQGFIAKYKVTVDKREDIKAGKGYRHLYIVRNIVNKAIELNLSLTRPKHELVEAYEIDSANNTISILNKQINDLKFEIFKKENTLQRLSQHIEIVGKKLKQSLDQPLLDEDAILLLAGVRRKRCGVYFLVNDDEIVYVGQSINIHQRIGEHEKTKIFTTFTYVECSYEELNKIEARYIDMFKPKYNYNSLGRLVMPMSKEQANYIYLGN